MSQRTLVWLILPASKLPSTWSVHVPLYRPVLWRHGPTLHGPAMHRSTLILRPTLHRPALMVAILLVLLLVAICMYGRWWLHGLHGPHVMLLWMLQLWLWLLTEAGPAPTALLAPPATSPTTPPATTARRRWLPASRTSVVHPKHCCHLSCCCVGLERCVGLLCVVVSRCGVRAAAAATLLAAAAAAPAGCASAECVCG